METIGERIKELRKSVDLSQKEFSKKIGISQGSLSDIEKGRNKPSIETFIAISNQFNVTIDWIIKGDMSNIKFRNSSDIPLGQIIKKLMKAIHIEKKKISEEFGLPLEHINKTFNFVMINRYLKSLTDDQLEFLILYKRLPVKDQNELRQLMKIKFQTLKEGT
ncbi:MAG: helix-turn-helix domain-containing protein [Bacillaceae bacterium]|nr:helix-turn-helix domain-containing protein [Bacillaceae bacterium]